MIAGVELTVVIPTRDRPAQLEACLGALAQQHFPMAGVEVIVVDDGSREPVEPVVAPLRQRLQLELVRQSGSGPAAARNLGVANARGRFLAFTDDDCRPAPEWLDRLAARLIAAPDVVVGGRTVNALSGDLCAEASQALVGYLYEYFNRGPEARWFLATNNLALARETFRSVGGFDPSFPGAAGEDRDFCDRLRRGGHAMAFAPDAVVLHAHPSSLTRFWAQHVGYGRGARRYWRLQRAHSGQGLRVEPLRFYLGMLRWPFRQPHIAHPRRVAALMALSQVANAVGFFL